MPPDTDFRGPLHPETKTAALIQALHSYACGTVPGFPFPFTSGAARPHLLAYWAVFYYSLDIPRRIRILAPCSALIDLSSSGFRAINTLTSCLVALLFGRGCRLTRRRSYRVVRLWGVQDTDECPYPPMDARRPIVWVEVTAPTGVCCFRLHIRERPDYMPPMSRLTQTTILYITPPPSRHKFI